MKTVAIIQARMGSSRLPGKVLRDLAGQPMLRRVLDRVRQATTIDDCVVATTTAPADTAVVAACQQWGVASYCGSEADVLDRYYQAATQANADVVVRITSDCPLIEPTIIDQVVQAFRQNEADYASNTLRRTFPRGLDTEVFSTAVLATAWHEATEPFQREHVTPYIYQNPSRFRLVELNAAADYGRHRWTVDTVEDWQLVQAIYAHFAPETSFSWQAVLRLLAEQPHLQQINAHIAQKELTER